MWERIHKPDMSCHDVETKEFQLVTNVDYTKLSTFFTKNIILIKAPNLIMIGLIDLVIYGWLCQGFSQVGTSQGDFQIPS
jgi:site-specific DNA-cytosine methylase